MKLKPNTTYRVVKDFWMWGTFSAVQLMDGQIISTLEEFDDILAVECGPTLYIEIYVDNDYDGLLEEVI